MPSIQPATAEDIPTIRDLAHCIWWAHYPEVIAPEQIEYMLNMMYNVDTLERQITTEGHQYWLVIDKEIAIGFIAVRPQDQGAYFMQKFYLEGAEQQKGYGTAVFNLLLEQYPDLTVLRLAVNRQNYKAINFYFKIGFRIEKCMDKPIGKGFIMDDFQMIWKRKN